MIERVLKNDITKMIAALVAVGVLSALVLSMVYSYSIPRIRENTERALYEGIKNIFPEASDIEKTGHDGVFKVMNSQAEFLGYAFTAEGNGYQGLIKVIGGVDPAIQEMKGLEILESQETPGLGAEIAGDFKQQFSGLKVSTGIVYVRNIEPEKDGEVQAITGATISSRAVVNMLDDRLKEMKKNLE